MKVAKLYSYNDIRIEEQPIPEIGPDEALVRTRASGICTGDVMKWYIEKKAPMVLGHEPAGEITDTGRDAGHFNIGDRVFIHHHAPCFVCNYCKRGDYVQCATWKKSRIIPGGISEYILVPGGNLKNDTHKLPDHVSFEAATLIEPTACVVKSIKRAGMCPGDTVLVMGLGVMGLLHVMIAKKSGAGRIIGADLVGYRLEKAIEAGADNVIDIGKTDLFNALKGFTDGRMAHIVIVGPNSADAMKKGLSCVAAGGTVVFFTPSMPGESINIDPNQLYFNDISIVTSYSCGPTDTADALELIESGAISADLLITHRFFINDTAKAFELTARAKESLKNIIVFD
ncbi:sorbitol dehydrogenase [bacterium BMS3Abin07]|nr:sorbitol dehydrogenase [bacterium BMS3Abin07]GBE32022.1 sorbitol dehydrogenase [bacterium BMS3Bbin05]HDO21634.1 sorbitol dehydrogenase [Nitrospirota bacterium]HDZ88734.1 sorbitol dehydrogenase [Nitrospirota bacterium]